MSAKKLHALAIDPKTCPPAPAEIIIGKAMIIQTASVYKDAFTFGNGFQSRISSSYPAVNILNSSHENAAVTRSLLTDYGHSVNGDVMTFFRHGGYGSANA
jgi:hypothetical protein